MNSVQVSGRLTRAPVVRFEPDGGVQTCTFTLAVPEPRQDGSTYLKYIPCQCYGRSAEVASLLNAEDQIEVQGGLGWRKHRYDCGKEHSQLIVHVREVQLAPACTSMTGNPH